jgi:hypothetical protein
MHDLQFREIARDVGIIGADGVLDALKDGNPGANSWSGKRSGERQEHQSKKREQAGVSQETRVVKQKARDATRIT